MYDIQAYLEYKGPLMFGVHKRFDVPIVLFDPVENAAWLPDSTIQLIVNYTYKNPTLSFTFTEEYYTELPLPPNWDSLSTVGTTTTIKDENLTKCIKMMADDTNKSLNKNKRNNITPSSYFSRTNKKNAKKNSIYFKADTVATTQQPKEKSASTQCSTGDSVDIPGPIEPKVILHNECFSQFRKKMYLCCEFENYLWCAARSKWISVQPYVVDTFQDYPASKKKMVIFSTIYNPKPNISLFHLFQFVVIIDIHQGYNFPTVITPDNKETVPVTYIVLRKDCEQPIRSNIVDSSENPIYSSRIITTMYADALANNGELIFEVWRKLVKSDEPNFETDILVGYIRVDIHLLLRDISSLFSIQTVVTKENKIWGYVLMHVKIPVAINEVMQDFQQFSFISWEQIGSIMSESPPFRAHKYEAVNQR